MNEKSDNIKEKMNNSGSDEMNSGKQSENTGNRSNDNPLDRALEKYYENPCREVFYQFCDEMVRALYFDITAVCPAESGSSGLQYKQFPTPDYGYAYIVYTSIGKNPDADASETYLFVPWRKILLRALEEPNSTGIVINPYSGHKDYIWLNKVYIRIILERAAKILEEASRQAGNPEKNG